VYRLVIKEWEESLDRVFELTLLLGEDMRNGLEREGLTASRAHLLLVLADRGPCSQRQLAGVLKVTPRTITALVDGLQSTGFVTREPEPGDRRVARVTMTARGQATARRLLDGRTRLARQVFAGLSAGRFKAFDGGLRQVLERLRELIDAADAAA
jgi:DNA-binding MarR family transcriptional regulator